MNEEIIKKINFNKTFNQSLNILLETYVLFYGEKYRNHITEKFNNMYVIGYCKPEDFNDEIEQIEILKLNELSKEFIDKIKINNLSKEEIQRIFMDEINDNVCISPIESYIDYINGIEDSLEDTLIFLNKIYSINITKENIDILIKDNYFYELDKIIPLYNKLIDTYKEYILSTKEYKLYLKKYLNLKDKLSKKYLTLLLKELKNKIPINEYSKIEEEYNLLINNLPCNEIYINKELYPSLLESFLLENHLIERILYFKKLGLNLGDNYEDYLNNKDTDKYLFNKNTIQILSNIRKRLYLQMRNEYYNLLPEYQYNRDLINKLELLDKDDGYDLLAYENEQTMNVPNIKKINNNYELYSLVLIYLANDDGYLDSFIIHELNHVINTSLRSFDGENYQIIEGWETHNCNLLNKFDLDKVYEKEYEEKREYELFNETINEIISQEITEIFISQNNYIFNNEDTFNYKGTNYELTKFLVEEFYHLYKKEIIESRINCDINIIHNTVGKSNFESLNHLFYLFSKYFKDDTIYEVYEDKEKGIVTEKTILYDDLCLKRDEILNDMKEYNKHKRKILV